MNNGTMLSYAHSRRYSPNMLEPSLADYSSLFTKNNENILYEHPWRQRQSTNLFDGTFAINATTHQQMTELFYAEYMRNQHEWSGCQSRPMSASRRRAVRTPLQAQTVHGLSTQVSQNSQNQVSHALQIQMASLQTPPLGASHHQTLPSHVPRFTPDFNTHAAPVDSWAGKCMAIETGNLFDSNSHYVANTYDNAFFTADTDFTVFGNQPSNKDDALRQALENQAVVMSQSEMPAHWSTHVQHAESDMFSDHKFIETQPVGGSTGVYFNKFGPSEAQRSPRKKSQGCSPHTATTNISMAEIDAERANFGTATSSSRASSIISYNSALADEFDEYKPTSWEMSPTEADHARDEAEEDDDDDHQASVTRNGLNFRKLESSVTLVTGRKRSMKQDPPMNAKKKSKKNERTCLTLVDAHTSDAKHLPTHAKICVDCLTKDTPLWRKDGETGGFTCNKCGIRRKRAKARNQVYVPCRELTSTGDQPKLARLDRLRNDTSSDDARQDSDNESEL